MKAIWFLTARQLRRGGWRSGLALCAALLSVILLSGTLLGGQALSDLLVRGETLGALVPLIRAAAAVLIVFLLLATGVLIRSSFAASLAQRVRMLGQLASVGATRRQLRASVYLEALLLGAVAIPAGLLAALAGLGTAFALLNRSGAFAALFGRLRLPLSPPLLAGCALLSLLELLLAAHGPARRAFCIAPLDAVRRPAEAGAPRRARRWKKGAGAPAQLARRSLDRAGARFRPLAASIAACVAAVLVSAGFIEGVGRAYGGSVPTYHYRACVWGNAGSRPAAALAEIGGWDGVLVAEEFYYWQTPDCLTFTVILEDDDFARWYGAPMRPQAGEVPCVEASAGSSAPAAARAPLYEDFTSVLAGSCDDPLPYGCGPSPYSGDVSSVRVTSRSAMEAVTGGDGFTRQDRSFAVYADPKDAPALTQRLTSFFRRAQITQYAIQDYTPGSEWAVRRAAVPLLLRVFFGGFLALVLAFCAAGVLGTVGAGLQLRRRELALLRAAGASVGQLRRMLALEAVSYGAAGVLFGLPLGMAFLALIGRLLWMGLFDLFSPLPALAACLGAAGVSGLALAVSLRALERLPLAEALSSGE
ncbi:FtsX-like permease family protein [Anaerofilum sp. BX8]|uniref:FtsX-like permease family protein n=1 Tax=Anaerofilum hominis TaxID=2763016 RepID=A0A923L210_9FIRM|nr:FtsX-like permease family protein [Anaerofilum hominis]MBC5582366.1 FtsX-like permease family protein [Anaerofilum hominis]